MNAVNNIYAVVVWYQPTEEQVSTLRTYSEAVQHVIVVDNSKEDHSRLLCSLSEDRCTYLPQHDNTGIGAALNIGCRLAIAHGAKWIMTMDQDSRWEEEQLEKYIRYVNEYAELEKAGVFSPRQDYTGRTRQYAQSYEQKIAVMTSGCLISASGFAATGGFREELFIDEVDNEYCMHIRRLGMQVVIINDAVLKHQLGSPREIRLLGIWRKEYIYHAPFRYYYITRNILYLSRLYPEYRRFNRKRLNKMLKRVVLYHSGHRIEILRMCLNGWRDYKAGRMGRSERFGSEV